MFRLSKLLLLDSGGFVQKNNRMGKETLTAVELEPRDRLGNTFREFTVLSRQVPLACSVAFSPVFSTVLFRSDCLFWPLGSALHE